MNKLFLINFFVLSVFLFLYGIYARTLFFAFVFLLIAVFIVFYYLQNKQLEQCHNKLKEKVKV